MGLNTRSIRSSSQLGRLRARRNGTVVLFGEVLADVFPDQTVLGGAPFNVARHLKAFGQNPVLVTRLGNDTLGNEVLDVMMRNGMETLGVQCGNRYPTGRVQVHIKNGEHRFEITPQQAYDFIHPAVARMIALSVHPTLVYFGTLAQRQEVSRRALKTLLRSTSAMRFLDINLRLPWYNDKILRQSLQYANVVKLNADELAILAKTFALPGNENEQIVSLLRQFNLEQAVITCGEDGAWQINREGKRIDVGVKNKLTRLMDTVGAGDGFAAVCILGTLKRWPVPKTLERAISFATAICEIRGAIPNHVDFYKPFSQEWCI